jgi:hypothetical protein
VDSTGSGQGPVADPWEYNTASLTLASLPMTEDVKLI